MLGGDIVHVNDSANWLIVGFFTRNYRPLSERFAESLQQQNLPHHLFAVERIGDWSRETMRKPSVVLDAMRAYPSRTVILMDVDCLVNGSLDELVEASRNADFSCYASVRIKGHRRSSLRFSLSSRVMVIRPTPGAERMMREWEKVCRERPDLNGDERALVMAFARANGVNFSPMSEKYSGRELGEAAPGSIITHRSAAFSHGKRRSLSNKFDELLAFAKNGRRRILGYGLGSGEGRRL